VSVETLETFLQHPSMDPTEIMAEAIGFRLLGLKTGQAILYSSLLGHGDSRETS